MSEIQPQQKQRAPRRQNNRNHSSQNAKQSGARQYHGGNKRTNDHSKHHEHHQLRSGKIQEQLLTPVQQRRRPSDNDIAQILKSGALIGSSTVSAHMKPYMFDPNLCKLLLAEQQQRVKNARGRNQIPQNVSTIGSSFDFRKTWNQLNLAAVTLASVVDPSSQILFVASNERSGFGAARAASHLKAQAIIGRYVPGTLSNPAQKTFIEPTWIVCASANEDVQAIKETSKSNTAVIAFCDATSNLTNIDIPIGCNTKSRLGIGLMFYLLLRQTLRHKGLIPFDSEIEDLMVDHFIQQKKKDEGVDVGEKAENEQIADNEEEQIDFNAQGNLDNAQMNNFDEAAW